MTDDLPPELKQKAAHMREQYRSLVKQYEYPDAASEDAPEEVREAVERFREEVPEDVKDETALLWWLLPEGAMSYKMSKEDAAYKTHPVGEGDEIGACANCAYTYYSNESGRLICSKVEGEIGWNHWCKLWSHAEPDDVLKEEFGPINEQEAIPMDAVEKDEKDDDTEEKSTPEGVPEDADYVSPDYVPSEEEEVVESDYGGQYVIIDDEADQDDSFDMSEVEGSENIPDDISEEDFLENKERLEDAPSLEEDGDQFVSEEFFSTPYGEGTVVAFKAYGSEEDGDGLEYSDSINAVSLGRDGMLGDESFITEDGRVIEVGISPDPEELGMDVEDHMSSASAEAAYVPVGTKSVENKTVDLPELEQKVELSDLPTPNPGEFHDSLNEKREETMSILREAHSEEAVDEFEEQMSPWYDPTQSYVQVPELWGAASSMIEDGGEIPESFDEEDIERIENIDEEVLNVYQDLFRISQEAFREEFGESEEVYRGYDIQTIREYGEKTEDGVEITPQALESWSFDESKAVSYGDATMKTEVSPDDVAVLGAIALGMRDEDYQEATLFGNESYVIPDLPADFETEIGEDLPVQEVEKSVFGSMMPVTYSDWLSEEEEKEKRDSLYKPFAGYDDMSECMEAHSDKDDPGAYCAQIHYNATGEWPSEKIGKSSIFGREWHQEREVQRAAEMLDRECCSRICECYKEQIWPEDLNKSPSWQDDDDVTEQTQNWVETTLNMRSPLWDAYADIPESAGLRVEQIIEDSLTQPQGWSLESVVNQIDDEFEFISRGRAKGIARQEVAAVLNEAEIVALQARPDDTIVRWVGPDDVDTTEMCKTIKERVGDGVPVSELLSILEEVSDDYKNQGGTPERADQGVPHFGCRHTLEEA